MPKVGETSKGKKAKPKKPKSIILTPESPHKSPKSNPFFPPEKVPPGLEKEVLKIKDISQKIWKIEGYTDGMLGIYFNTDERLWCLSHMKVHERYVAVKEFDDVLKVREVIKRHGWKGMRLFDREEIIKATPRWLIQWTKKVSRMRKYLDPTEFKEATDGD